MSPEPAEPPAQNAPDALVGTVIGGRYRTLRKLGSGGLGTVYVARHDTLGRDVAVKVLQASVAAVTEHVQRFDREARALARLKHPNIVTVLDFGSENGTSFLVMELAEGEPLDAMLQGPPVPVAAGLDLVRQLVRALAYAHGEGVIHRDLKPANVVVRRMPDGSHHLVVLDFGIAKVVADDAPSLTRQGAIIGTPAYMPPEQASGSSGKPTVDVYSAGLVAYEILAWRRPFVDKDRAGLLRAHLMTPPPLPSSVRPELAAVPGLDAFLLKALEKKPVNRFADANAMLAAFERILVGAHETADADARSSRADSPMPGAPREAPFGATSTTPPPVEATSTPSTPAPVGAMPTASVSSVASPLQVSVETVRTALRSLPRTTRLALAAGAVVFALGVVGVGVHLASDSDPPSDAPAVVVPAVGAPTTPTVGSSPNTPFDRGVPPDLASLHRSITAGSRPSRDAIQQLYRYNARETADARGLLLLGWTATDRRWFSDAIDAYGEACRREPSSANDPRLVADLLRFVAVAHFADGAERVLVSCVGADAIPAAERAAASSTDPNTRARLEALIGRLRALPPSPSR